MALHFSGSRSKAFKRLCIVYRTFLALRAHFARKSRSKGAISPYHIVSFRFGRLEIARKARFGEADVLMCICSHPPAFWLCSASGGHLEECCQREQQVRRKRIQEPLLCRRFATTMRPFSRQFRLFVSRPQDCRSRRQESPRITLPTQRNRYAHNNTAPTTTKVIRLREAKQQQRQSQPKHSQNNKRDDDKSELLQQQFARLHKERWLLLGATNKQTNRQVDICWLVSAR